MGYYSITIRDRSGELSNVGFKLGPVTAVTLPGHLTATGTLRDAIDDITLGVIAKDEMKVYSNQLDASTPASPWANRETKFLVRYKDVTAFFDPGTNSIPNEGFGRTHNVEIPCPDLALTNLLLPNSDFVNLAQTEIAAFITAFEAEVLSPSNGAVEVQSIELVGRRN